MLLRQWAVDDNLVILSTELIMLIVHCKEFVKLAFQALALRQSLWRKAKAQTSALEIFYSG